MNKPACILWEGDVGPRQIGGEKTYKVVVHAKRRATVNPDIEKVSFSSVGVDEFGNRWLGEMSRDVEDRVRAYVLREMLRQRFIEREQASMGGQQG